MLRRQILYRSLKWAIVAAALVVSFCSSVLSQHSNPSTTVGLRIIVVASPTEAQQILERLRKVEHFAALAREKSVDATAADGGDMGQVDPASLRQELR